MANTQTPAKPTEPSLSEASDTPKVDAPPAVVEAAQPEAPTVVEPQAAPPYGVWCDTLKVWDEYPAGKPWQTSDPEVAKARAAYYAKTMDQEAQAATIPADGSAPSAFLS